MIDTVVSVCCLAYNEEEFIGEALNGIVMQRTDFPFEAIVHDDASTDKTAEIIRDYAKQFPEIIRPIYQEKNVLSTGPDPGVAFVFPASRGRYIALCDGDDYWTDPHKLQKQVAFMDVHPQYSICYHDYRVKIGDDFVDELHGRGPDYTTDQLIAISTTHFHMATSTMMFRNVYSPKTKRDFENFPGHYMRTVMLGMFGGCKFLPGFSPSVYRKHAHNFWAQLPKEEIARRTAWKLVRLRELFAEKTNPTWIALRKGVE